MVRNEKDSLIRDNAKYGSVFEFLKSVINSNFDKYNTKSKLKIVSAYFTIYAFAALREELKDKVSDVQFVLGEPSSVENLGLKKKRFKIFKIQDENISIEKAIEQNKIAKECYEWLEQSNIEIRTAPKKDNKKTLIHAKMYHIEQENNDLVVKAIIGSSNFTVCGLGINDCSNFELNTIIDSDNCKADLKEWFNELWNNNTEDAKKEILDYIEAIYKENSPEQVYYKTLYHLFEEKLEDNEIEDVEKNQKFIETKIWKDVLYPFQKDAVKSIWRRLQKYNGCILADSVGLGKTFTALGVIQYAICKGKTKCLVLAPKRLENNWKKYEEYHPQNIFKDDKLRIKFLPHSMLTAKDIDKEVKFNDFDLIVIDESHNFRNATHSRTDEYGNIKKISRYDKLFDIIKNGERHPMVLMLSATPVNTSLQDLKNQIDFISLGNDKAFETSLQIPSIEGAITTANRKYIQWAKDENRNKNDLLNTLNANFFKLLEELTIARSRKHIKTGYGDNKNLNFPKRKNPKTITPSIDLENKFLSYKELNEEILKYQLYLFRPSKHVIRNHEKYQSKKDTTMTQEKREFYLIGMMKTGFFKRLESSIYSFTISMNNTLKKIDSRIALIDKYKQNNIDITVSNDDAYFDDFEDDTEISDNEYVVGKKMIYHLSDLNIDDWKKELLQDRVQIEKIYNMARKITTERDKKLSVLKEIITDKSKQENKKLLIFTTYSDTAKYLYDSLKDYVKNELNIHIALVTGKKEWTSSTYKNLNNFDDILENFSPYSKLGETRQGNDQIDILIGTDCISEGQNLQDCDTIVNYDIHWNPVRLIQRFGRIDRIGSTNDSIQMICFWPTEDLENYLQLRNRVESRMVLADASATADDNPLEEQEAEEIIKRDLTYRERQLKRIMEEKPLEDTENSMQDISMSDFSLEDFQSDLLNFIETRKKDLKNMPIGICAITPNTDNNGNKIGKGGIIFCLKQKNSSKENSKLNKLQPYYLVYVKNDGSILYTYERAREILDIYKALCLGKNEPIIELCKKFNNEIQTQEGKEFYNKLLKLSINSIKDDYDKNIFASLLNNNDIIPKKENQINSIDDFELITWLIIT